MVHVRFEGRSWDIGFGILDLGDLSGDQEVRRARIAFDAYQFTGDYYALPNLLPLLTRPTRLDLLLEIMAYPLPQRKAA